MVKNRRPVISRTCFLGTVVVAERLFDASDFDDGMPSPAGPVQINALIPARIIGPNPGVPGVAAAIRDPEIVPSVIQSVTVGMIDLSRIIGIEAEYEPVEIHLVPAPDRVVRLAVRERIRLTGDRLSFDVTEVTFTGEPDKCSYAGRILRRIGSDGVASLRRIMGHD